jgi:putative colanic acid biosynthesis glycosyltransferase
LKVLLIDVNCKQSSTGNIVYDLYKDLKNEGHTAGICYGRGPIVKETNIYKFSIDPETYLHALLTRLTGLTGGFSPISTTRLINFIEKFKPDVVHLHELHGYFVNINILINYLKNKNIKTIWTFHCEFMYTGKCGHSDDCEKWKTECDKCPKVKEYPSSLYFDFSKKMFNQKKQIFKGFNNLTIVTPSKWLAERVKKSFLRNKKIKVIYNGIDTKKIFHPKIFKSLKSKYNLTDEKIVIAVAPNLDSENKGGKWVLELANNFKDENVKFFLIGLDKQKNVFGNNIVALGTISNQILLSEYYSMADVFIICSHRETFSLTCAEALCCGTEVAGFKSGAPETIFQTPYANFTEYGDINSLKDVVMRIFEKPLNQKKISNYGKKNFDKKIMFENYLSLYKN